MKNLYLITSTIFQQKLCLYTKRMATILKPYNIRNWRQKYVIEAGIDELSIVLLVHEGKQA